jgi:hypothetical protein
VVPPSNDGGPTYYRLVLVENRAASSQLRSRFGLRTTRPMWVEVGDHLTRLLELGWIYGLTRVDVLDTDCKMR